MHIEDVASDDNGQDLRWRSDEECSWFLGGLPAPMRMELSLVQGMKLGKGVFWSWVVFL